MIPDTQLKYLVEVIGKLHFTRVHNYVKTFYGLPAYTNHSVEAFVDFCEHNWHGAMHLDEYIVSLYNQGEIK